MIPAAYPEPVYVVMVFDVPEPSSLAMALAAILTIAFLKWRSKR